MYIYYIYIYIYIYLSVYVSTSLHPLLIFILVDTTIRWIFSIFSVKVKSYFGLPSCKAKKLLQEMELQENEEDKDDKYIG